MEKKLKTREFALTRIAAKTWGPGLIRAREVYTKCIRSAIAYGASSYHEPTESKGRPEGVAKELGKAQNRSLRVVAGAYRAAPIRALETEAWVPPLDIYLTKRLADFEKRIREPRYGPGRLGSGPSYSRPEHPKPQPAGFHPARRGRRFSL